MFFATDLHGSTMCFRKFLTAARVYRVNVLVLGGDLTGKTLTPLVAEGSRYRVGAGPDGRYLESDDELAAFVLAAADSGSYCAVVDEEEATKLASNEGYLAARIGAEAVTRAREWVRLAQERLGDASVSCLVTGGNDDTADILDALPRELTSPIRLCEGDVVPLEDTDVEIASVGYSNPTPWRTPREISEEELRRRIDEVVSKAAEPARTIFNFHAPPAGSGLDRCAELDVSTDPPTPVRVGGEIVYTFAGSTAVRDALVDYQPLLGLHGHIHESRGSARIGRTVALNPGSEYQEGILRGVIVGIKGESITHQFTSG